MNWFERLISILFRHVDILQKDGSLYLRRWFLFRNRLYLHKICQPDEDKEPHDHPWAFSTLILRGGYMDLSFTPTKYGLFCVPDSLGWLSFRRRKATHLHKVWMPKNRTKNTWTLVYRGPYERHWGYVMADGRWVFWRVYKKFWAPDPYDSEGDLFLNTQDIAPYNHPNKLIGNYDKS